MSAASPALPYVCFSSSSSAKSQLYYLSNFADTPITITWPEGVIPAFLAGRTCRYDTTEHAWQALTKAGDLNTAKEFETDGKVSMDAFRRWPVRRGIYKVNGCILFSAA